MGDPGPAAGVGEAREDRPARGRSLRPVLLEHVAEAGVGELELVDREIAEERRVADRDDAVPGRVPRHVLDLDTRRRREIPVDQLETPGGVQRDQLVAYVSAVGILRREALVVRTVRIV